MGGDQLLFSSGAGQVCGVTAKNSDAGMGHPCLTFHGWLREKWLANISTSFKR